MFAAKCVSAKLLNCSKGSNKRDNIEVKESNSFLTIPTFNRKNLQSTKRIQCCFGRVSLSIRWRRVVSNRTDFSHNMFRMRAIAALYWYWQFSVKLKHACDGDGPTRAFSWGFIPVLQTPIRYQDSASNCNLAHEAFPEDSRWTNHSSWCQARQLPDRCYWINSRHCLHHWFWFGEMLPEQCWRAYSLQRREELNWNCKVRIDCYPLG